VIVLDTSGLLAALDGDHPRHPDSRAVLDQDPGPFLLSPLVLAEADYLLSTRMGTGSEIAFLRQVSAGAYRLEPLSVDDIGVATDLVERYAQLNVGLADASLVVIAAREGTTRLLTFDERHFRTIRPLRGRAFKLLPADG
jgi:predicted nucleic acid-binding protein